MFFLPHPVPTHPLTFEFLFPIFLMTSRTESLFWSYKVNTTRTESLFWSYNVRTSLTDSLLLSYKVRTSHTESLFWSYKVRTSRTESLFWSYKARTSRTESLFWSYKVPSADTEKTQKSQLRDFECKIILRLLLTGEGRRGGAHKTLQTHRRCAHSASTIIKNLLVFEHRVI